MPKADSSPKHTEKADEIAEHLWDDPSMVKRRINEPMSFAFHGEAVDDGTISIDDYGQAIIGYSRMVRVAVRELDPHATIPDVRVTYQQRGSFITGVQILTEMSLGSAILEWLNGTNASGISTGLSIAVDGGAIISSCVLGAIGLAKYIRGRIVASRKPATTSGIETVTLDDGDTINAPTQIINITMNNSFRSNAQSFIAPTTRRGIDSVSIGSTTTESETLTASDLHSFDTEDAEAESVHEYPVRLEVLRIAFDGGKWRFVTVPDDRSIPEEFAADVLDEDFLHDVESGISFAHGDQLDVILRVTIPKRVSERRRPIREVVKVNEIIKHYEPPTLLGELDES